MYTLLPAEQNESGAFFRLSDEAAERYGSVGYLRQDFGRDGREFHTTWFDMQPRLKTPAFKAEFDEIINSLRDDGEKPPFANRANLTAFCAANQSFALPAGRGDGYVIRTLDFSYYIRCKPRHDDYDVYAMAYDNRYLLPELAGKHELPEMCYGILPSGGDIIVVRSGERGYYGCQATTNDAVYNRAYVNDKNKELGVTRAQEEACLAGSLFGWNTAAAKPWNYDLHGKPLPLAPRKNEPER